MPTPDAQLHQDADLLELRVAVASLGAGVEQLRQTLVPLAGMPHQLDALQQLHSERLTNHIANHERDVKDLHADLEAEAGRRRAGHADLVTLLEKEVTARQTEDSRLEARLTKAIEAVQDWQTWALRAIVGLVIAAVVAAVLVAP